MVNDSFVIIPNNLLYKYKENNSNKVLILALIQQNMSIRGKCIFNVKWLLDKMNIKLNDTRRIKQVHNYILELQSEGILVFDEVITKLNNTELLFASVKAESNFTKINDDESEIIYSYSDQNVNIKDLLSLFANIKGRIDDKGYCYPSINLITEDLGISEDTVTKYNNILCNELKLILIENIGSRVFADGTIKRANNLYAINNEYGRKKLNNKVLECKAELEEQQIKLVKGENGNKKRSIKLKQRHLQDKFDRGLISEMEFEKKYSELDEEYDKLVAKIDKLTGGSNIGE